MFSIAKKVILIMIFALLTAMYAGAETINTDIVFEEKSKEDAERFVSSVNAYRFDFEPELFCFNHFAVNKGGNFAIGKDDSKIKTICVYNCDGTFLYGINFEYSGSYRLKWDDYNLVIYFARSDVLVSYNRFAQVQCVADIIDSKENNVAINNEFSVKEHNVKNEIFKADGYNFLGGNYTKVIKTNHLGDANVIYDASGKPNMVAILTTIVILAIPITLICFIVALITFEKRKRKKGNT